MITQLQRIKVARRIAVGLLFVFMAIAPMLASTEGSLGAPGQDGTPDNPFTINNADELAYLAEVVNSWKKEVQLTGGGNATISPGFEGSYIQLAANIDLNGENWTPIGISGKPFYGNFDGKGHCVSGLTVVIEEEANSTVYIGLFGYAANGTIQNLGVKVHAKGIKASGKDCAAGGIAGSTAAATIRNCYVEGPGLVEAEGTQYSRAGGIAGFAENISHCYATVDVKASKGAAGCYAGGIAGSASGSLSYTYATGNVEASGGYSYAGGICGHSGGSLLHNLALNKEVKGDREDVHRVVGGIDNSAFPTPPSSNYASPDMYVKGQLVDDTNANGFDGSNTGIDLTNYAQNNGAPNEWSSDAWIFDSEGNILPQLQMVTDENGLLSYSKWTNSPQPKLTAANYLPAIEIKEGDDGTSWEKAIEISNSSELAYLARMVNTGGDLTVGSKTINNNGNGFSGKHFILTDNIDLSAYNWTPIGNSSQTPFCGHFDGKGHVVNGLKIKMNVKGGTKWDWTFAGLFGYVLNGTLQNIGVELADEGIEVSAEKGDVFAGGIAGRIDGRDNGTAILRHCYVTGGNQAKIKITEAGISAYVGGIAGWGSIVIGGNLTLTHCYATVDVESNATSNSYAGGIAGYSDNASYCFATGNVKAKTYSGGICGNGTVSNSLALNPEIEGNGWKNRITAFSSTSNYASPQTKIEGYTTTSIDPNSWDGADTWLDTFKDDLLKAPNEDNGWSEGKGWKWPEEPSSTQLPKLKVAVTNEEGVTITSYTDWPSAQPDFDVASYATDCPRLYIQSPEGITLTVTDTDNADTPINNDSQVRPGTHLKLSHTITQEGYSLDKYLYGTNADLINQEIDVDTHVMPNQHLWISASVKYTDPKPDPDPDPDPDPKPDPEPVYPPPTPIYYTVTLPQVEGATTDPEAGIHEVESWNTFRFYLTLDPDYSDSQPIVTTSRGETLVPRQSDGAYLVKYVRSDVEISIDSIRPNLPPVANEAIDAPANRPRIWTEASTLCIGMPQTAPASTAVNVFAADGRLWRTLSAAPGLNRQTLPRGFYIIRVDDVTRKVIVR